MSTTWVDEALPESHKRVIVNELVNGRNRARELRSLLSNRVVHGGSSSSMTSRAEEDELVKEIMTSCTESLSVLIMSETSNKLCGGGDDNHLVKAELSSHVEHSHCGGGERSSGDSSESKKRPVSKDRRGCYRRRKNSDSWSKVSSSLADGQAWRKYGQKEILNASYPRAYFRCTGKYDQGCQAIKQVQQIQNTPKVYKTTYIGKHTCILVYPSGRIFAK